MTSPSPLPTSLSSMLDFLEARAREDEGAAYADGSVDLVLVDGSRITLAGVERVRSQGDDPRTRRRLHALQMRAELYADHPDYREEWRPGPRRAGDAPRVRGRRRQVADHGRE